MRCLQYGANSAGIDGAFAASRLNQVEPRLQSLDFTLFPVPRRLLGAKSVHANVDGLSQGVDLGLRPADFGAAFGTFRLQPGQCDGSRFGRLFVPTGILSGLA